MRSLSLFALLFVSTTALADVPPPDSGTEDSGGTTEEGGCDSTGGAGAGGLLLAAGLLAATRKRA